MTDNEKCFTTDDVMRKTGLTRVAVLKYASTNKTPGYTPKLKVHKRVGMNNLYLRDDVMTWIETWKQKNHAAGRPRKEQTSEPAI